MSDHTMAEGGEGTVLFVRNEKPDVKEEEKSGEDGGSTTADDDIWDDTALVQAYDRAVSLAKEEVARRMGLVKESPSGVTKKKKKKKNNKQEWHVGDPCAAVYSGDGVIYEATVEAMFQNKGTCLVRYVGYNNEEEIPLKMLRPSQGKEARKIQETDAEVSEEGQYLPFQNGLEMECSDGDSAKRPTSKPKTQKTSKSPQMNKMDWEFRTMHPPGPSYFPPNAPSLRMPPMGVPPMVVPPPPPPHLTATFPEEDSEALSAMLMSWYMSGFHTGYYQGLKQAKNFSYSGNSSRNSSRKK